MLKKSDIVEYWFENKSELQIIDVGEPSCWICGMWWGTDYDIKDPKATLKECYECWNAVPLQKCHIVPKSLGGSNSNPSNFVLACSYCHNDMPDCYDPDIFFKWVKKYKKWIWKNRIEELKSNLDFFDLSINDLFIGQSKEFQEWSKDKVGFHGFRIKTISILGLVSNYKSI